MPCKDFAMISTTLPYSRKYRAVSILAKLVYNHLHYSGAANYIGVFKYHEVVLAHEVDIPTDELEGALVELETNGLIERDADKEVIRIVGWFHKANRATNASHARKLITDFCEVDFAYSNVLLKAIAEFTVATLKRGLKWKKDAQNLRGDLQPFLNTLMQDNKEAFAIPMLDEIANVGQSLQHEVNSLIPNLPEYEPDTLSTGCTTGGGDTRLDDTKLKQNLNKTNTETCPNFTNDSDQPLIEDQEPTVAGLRTKGTKPKRPNTHASQAAKDSALAKGLK
jgi:hypothetical protein